jgi:hypothetical protein
MSLYNALFGLNPSSHLLLAMLNLSKNDVGRFRDCYLKRNDDGLLNIVVYTRNGGGNREDYEEVTEALQHHPAYLSDRDDDFDSTYAAYVFSVPDRFKETAVELEKLGAAPTEEPMDKFQKLIEKLRTGSTEDPSVKKVLLVSDALIKSVLDSNKAAT